MQRLELDPILLRGGRVPEAARQKRPHHADWTLAGPGIGFGPNANHAGVATSM